MSEPNQGVLMYTRPDNWSWVTPRHLDTLSPQRSCNGWRITAPLRRLCASCRDNRRCVHTRITALRLRENTAEQQGLTHAIYSP